MWINEFELLQEFYDKHITLFSMGEEGLFVSSTPYPSVVLPTFLPTQRLRREKKGKQKERKKGWRESQTDGVYVNL